MLFFSPHLYTLFIIFTYLYSFSCLAQQNAEINLGQVPFWVVEREIGQLDDIPIEEVADGLHYQMVDNQIQVMPTGERNGYSRYVETIVNQSGLDSSSQLNLKYAPSYQKLVLHSLYVIRDGERFDRLTSAKKSILNTESELKRQIYSGTLTLNVLISDLKVGDTLDYSFTRYGSNPVYHSSFSYHRNVNWSMPLDKQHLRILWGKSKPLYVTAINSDPAIIQEVLGDYTEYQINLEKPPVIDSPSQTPRWYTPYGSVYFSESQSWSDVVAWAKPFYHFGDNESVKRVADEIKKQHSLQADQIIQALKFTQEKIRYVGLEMGADSHIPTSPGETLELKYGDCKDKSILLIAILAELGVEAFPALVDTEYTNRLEKMPPAASLFNHVLVSLPYQGKQIWLDPTLINQHGSLSTIYQPDYGVALVLKAGEKELTPMAGNSRNSYTQITERYRIPEELPKSTQFDVSTQHAGLNAIEFLERVEQDGQKKVADSYESYYQRIFSSLVTSDPMRVEVDDQQGAVIVEEHYEIAEFWEMGDEDYEADFYPTDIRNAVFKPEQIKRNGPLALEYPNNLSNHFEIYFEEEGWNFENENFVEDNPFFSFHKTVYFENNTLYLQFDYVAKRDHVEANQIDNYLVVRDKLRDEAYFGLIKFADKEVASSPSAFSLDDISIWHVLITIYILGLGYIIVSWQLESRQRPEFSDSHFYPISVLKFVIMGIGTLGMYEVYWSYRNWQAIKIKNNDDMMPIARGIFSPIWFYPLFNALKRDSEQRFNKNKVLWPILAVIFALTYFLTSYASSFFDNLILTVLVLLTPLLFVPSILYINSLNKQTSLALAYNSRWRARQIVALILCVPLVTYTLAIETPLLPGDSIRKESQILSNDLKFMYRKQVLPADETIQYFYSDAVLSNKDDGNGFTEQRAFSYWKDENGDFQMEVATYDQIKNIEVEHSTDEDSNTIITIKRQDSSEFMLFVSPVDDGDQLFFTTLNNLWKKQRALKE